MTRINIAPSATLMLTATLGCTIDLTGTTDSNSDPGTTTTTTTGNETTADTGGTTIEPGPTTSGTSGEPETGTTAATSTSETSGTSDTSTEPAWCNGFDPATKELTYDNAVEVKIVDGGSLVGVCGGQGAVMFPIFPHFGGYVPVEDVASFDVELDVEGFNLGPNGHFFEVIGHAHTINCTQEEDTYYDGYSYSFIPIFPPDGIPDINVLDGKPGVLKVTLHGADGDVPFEAAVVLSAMIDECYGGG